MPIQVISFALLLFANCFAVIGSPSFLRFLDLHDLSNQFPLESLILAFSSDIPSYKDVIIFSLDNSEKQEKSIEDLFTIFFTSILKLDEDEIRERD